MRILKPPPLPKNISSASARTPNLSACTATTPRWSESKRWNNGSKRTAARNRAAPKSSTAVRKIKNFKGVTGSIEFDNKGDPVKAKYFVLAIRKTSLSRQGRQSHRAASAGGGRQEIVSLRKTIEDRRWRIEDRFTIRDFLSSIFHPLFSTQFRKTPNEEKTPRRPALRRQIRRARNFADIGAQYRRGDGQEKI